MNILRMVLIIFMVVSIVGLAHIETSSAASTDASGSRGAGIKAERGVKNILFGWTEIPRSIIQVTRDSKNPIWGITGGTLKGFGKAFPRTVSGIADVATFPLGDYDKPLVKPDELNTQVQ